jgi:hypothetical protein
MAVERIYRTSDGRIFKNELEAIIYDNLLQINKVGSFGKPSHIEKSDDDGVTWRY